MFRLFRSGNYKERKEVSGHVGKQDLAEMQSYLKFPADLEVCAPAYTYLMNQMRSIWEEEKKNHTAFMVDLIARKAP